MTMSNSLILISIVLAKGNRNAMISSDDLENSVSIINRSKSIANMCCFQVSSVFLDKKSEALFKIYRTQIGKKKRQIMVYSLVHSTTPTCL